MIDKVKEQFDEWYFRRYGSRDLTQTFEHAVYQDALEVWKASRESLVVELPPFFNHPELDQCVEVGELIKAIESLGLRVKS